MKLKGRKKQIHDSLKQRGSQGLTVIEAMQLGLGTELRRNITSLIRLGYPITKKPQHISGRSFIRYVLEKAEPRKYNIIDNLTGEKREVIIR